MKEELFENWYEKVVTKEYPPSKAQRAVMRLGYFAGFQDALEKVMEVMPEERSWESPMETLEHPFQEEHRMMITQAREGTRAWNALRELIIKKIKEIKKMM